MTPRYTTNQDALRNPRRGGTYGPLYRAPQDERCERQERQEGRHDDSCDAVCDCTEDAYGCVDWFDFDAPGARARRLVDPHRT